MRPLFVILLGLFVLSSNAHINDSLKANAQVRSKQRKKSTRRYSCPMHPEVVAARPGKCPKCGMALRLVPKESAPAAAATTAEGTNAETKPADAPITFRIPDIPVLDQNGKRLNFYSDLVKGKTVAINFIFTTCTTICPPLTATFRRVQIDLAEHAGRDVSLISVSVDPTTDVPERLREFAANFKAGPGWTFVTGDRLEIDALLRAFGVAVVDKNDHTPTILIGNDRASQWTRMYGLAPPSTIAKMLAETANMK